MKKFCFAVIAISSLFAFVSCSRLDLNENKAETYTITINSPQGSSVMEVADNGLISRAVYKDNFMDIVTTRNYTYEGNELRSVDVSDNVNNAYNISYGDETKNSARSAIPEQENIPNSVRYVYKTHIKGSRAASADVTALEKIEYYYNEKGDVSGIIRIDGNGNVYARDMEQ